MARSLPLGNPAEGIGDSAAIDQSLTGRVEVYDPAMCCPTGICGPGVDPALLTITRDLRWLEKHGVLTERFGLSQSPDAFVRQTRIAGLMQAFGDAALPAALVDGQVLCYGRYPSRDELVSALSKKDAAPAATGQCCTPGSGCC